MDVIEPVDDEIQYLRTDDLIYLQCTKFSPQNPSDPGKYILSAEGFGQRKCHLETVTDENGRMPDMAMCAFVLKQALSLRALKESLARDEKRLNKEDKKPQPVADTQDKLLDNDNGTENKDDKPDKDEPEAKETDIDDPVNSGVGGHRTLLYGHAVRLQHNQSGRMLCSLNTTSSTNDKLAFDVGLSNEDKIEHCWWQIMPASKQRSEGEKVRIGDDFILVNVASERYLHMSIDKQGLKRVQASFQHTLWMVGPISTERQHGFLCGGDVLRLFHGRTSDDCLTIPTIGNIDQSDPNQNAQTAVYHPERRKVQYEGGGTGSQARSLWRIELEKVKWCGCHVAYGMPFHIRHITTGKFLGMGPNRQVILIESNSEEMKNATFCFRQNKDKTDQWDTKNEHDHMGPAEIKSGDSVAYIQHTTTRHWLTYQAIDLRAEKMGESKPAELHIEGHMDDGFSPSRSQYDESKTATIIRRTSETFTRFIKALESLQPQLRTGNRQHRPMNPSNHQMGNPKNRGNRSRNNTQFNHNNNISNNNKVPREQITHNNQFNYPETITDAADLRRHSILNGGEALNDDDINIFEIPIAGEENNNNVNQSSNQIPRNQVTSLYSQSQPGFMNSGMPPIGGGLPGGVIPGAGMDFVNQDNPLVQSMAPPMMSMPHHNDYQNPRVTKLSLTEFDQCIVDLTEHFIPAYPEKDYRMVFLKCQI